MPRKAKTEETVVTEESAILENAPAETGTFMEGDSPAEGEILMDGETPADVNFPMDGELPDSQEAAMDEELPGSGETAMGDGVPASDSAITDGDVLEETSLSGENMEAEAETGNDSGMELQQKDTGEAPVEGDGAAANANGPAPKLPSETRANDGSGTGKNNPEVSAPPRRRKAKAAPAPKQEPPVRKTAPSTILTLNADSEVETPESREDTIWHELQNAVDL
mgnify:CR=1 FL=1